MSFEETISVSEQLYEKYCNSSENTTRVWYEFQNYVSDKLYPIVTHDANNESKANSLTYLRKSPLQFCVGLNSHFYPDGEHLENGIRVSELQVQSNAFRIRLQTKQLNQLQIDTLKSVDELCNRLNLLEIQIETKTNRNIMDEYKSSHELDHEVLRKQLEDQLSINEKYQIQLELHANLINKLERTCEQMAFNYEIWMSQVEMELCWVVSCLMGVLGLYSFCYYYFKEPVEYYF